MEHESGPKAKVHGDFAGKGFVTVEDVSESSVIVIGRGKKAPAVKQALVPAVEEAGEALGLTFEDLTAQVDGSDQTPALKQRARVSLDSIRSEIERGDEGDVQVVRQALGDIGENTPELAEPLYHWLGGTEQASTAVKIIARKVLAQDHPER